MIMQLGNTYIWICVLILFVATYFTRLLPFLFCKGEVKNRFFKSVLAYLPYAVLTSMIFPEVFMIKGMGTIPAIVGFVIAVVLSFKNKNLITVLSFSTVAAFIMMLLNPHILKIFGF